ncbi:SDR family NAD(P)-dependent oxidoreductase [Agrococcus sp. SGAir0287]|uniref:SDR family NAD(P)-dependent oxidoreductase n=1 Tax=Agrococcus sp. SGAir0287 TaxID=2070347 RepID=UPI0010CCF2E0|nr:SDR family NAD(P)-dependent oxidoreductase [Agrococcus sp. SGAir0287]QCR18779.1 short-chain dehydrogenase/reductase [Agrococcus sp. SGAir0287]
MTAHDGTKTWLITGATNGLGRVWARAALERGDRVVATGRRIERLDDLVAVHGDALLPLRLDVADRQAVLEAVATAHEHLGRLDVVVNGAGYGQWGMVEELTERELREQLETNVLGTVWVTQAVLPILRRQRSGHVVQVTSEGGVRAYPGIGAYHASKWAVEGLSESLAQEVAGFGIHVTCVEPGPYDTGFSGAIRRSAPMPEYDAVRAADASTFSLGDPTATAAAVLRLVDAERPPRRLVLGDVVPAIVGIHEERIATWRAWEDVSLAAFGGERAKA